MVQIKGKSNVRSFLLLFHTFYGFIISYFLVPRHRIDITTARQGTDFNVSAIFLRTLRAYQSVDGGFHYGAYLTPGVDWNLLCLR